MPFLDDCLIACEAPTATGTTTIDSTAYDTAGYMGIMFIVRVGSTAANISIKAQQDTVVGMGTAADVKDTAITATSNNVLVLDVAHPQEQFVRCRVTRTTTTTIDTITVIRYGARKRPVTQAGTVSAEQYTSPIEGTA